MKMDSRNTVRTIASLLLLILLSCELSFVEATSPVTPDQLGTSADESIEFPQCNGLSGFRYFQCITRALVEFNQYYIADAVQCFQSVVGTEFPRREYVAKCFDCPPHRRCTSIGGICTEKVGSPILPAFFNDCNSGQYCEKEPGIEGCTSNLFGFDPSTCTCSDNGGIFVPQSDCAEQCGAPAFASDQPSNPAGLAPTVCCVPLHQCPEWHLYTCTDGSATYTPSCDGQGNLSCETGTLSLIVDPIPQPPLLGGVMPLESPGSEGPGPDIE